MGFNWLQHTTNSGSGSYLIGCWAMVRGLWFGLMTEVDSGAITVQSSREGLLYGNPSQKPQAAPVVYSLDVCLRCDWLHRQSEEQDLLTVSMQWDTLLHAHLYVWLEILDEHIEMH